MRRLALTSLASKNDSVTPLGCGFHYERFIVFDWGFRGEAHHRFLSVWQFPFWVCKDCWFFLWDLSFLSVRSILSFLRRIVFSGWSLPVEIAVHLVVIIILYLPCKVTGFKLKITDISFLALSIRSLTPVCFRSRAMRSHPRGGFCEISLEFPTFYRFSAGFGLICLKPVYCYPCFRWSARRCFLQRILEERSQHWCLIDF